VSFNNSSNKVKPEVVEVNRGVERLKALRTDQATLPLETLLILSLLLIRCTLLGSGIEFGFNMMLTTKMFHWITSGGLAFGTKPDIMKLAASATL
jgi:hypothetical protein